MGSDRDLGIDIAEVAWGVPSYHVYLYICVNGIEKQNN